MPPEQRFTVGLKILHANYVPSFCAGSLGVTIMANKFQFPVVCQCKCLPELEDIHTEVDPGLEIARS